MNIALIGAGRIGQLHGALVAAQPGVDEVLVADVDPGRTADTASAIGGRVAPTVEWALDHADAAVITASTEAHGRLVLAAIERGLPTFCEKPLAFDLAETVRVVDQVEATRRRRPGRLPAPVRSGLSGGAPAHRSRASSGRSTSFG